MANDLDRLQKAIHELDSINQILDRISRLRETNHIMSVLVDNMVRLTEADQGAIHLVAAASGDDLQTVVRSTQEDTDILPFQLAEQISGWVIRNGQTLRVDDLDNDDRFVTLDSEDGRYKSLLCCPMTARGETIGLASLIRDNSHDPFTEDHARVASIIAAQSSHILSNALLLEDIARKNSLLELSHEKLKDENLRLREEAGQGFAFEQIVGQSPPMKKILSLASKVCTNDAPVLITGPTGTGKELLARAIHYGSNRRDKPFVVKNCGVKTESLLEAELFGYVKGAFTGATSNKPGLFREADGGTIFLDEIGDAPLSTQVAVLRVLESGEIRPVGASKAEFVDVRLISATNQDLPRLIEQQEFRQDLFYRLNTFALALPALSERTSDIPLLVDHFIKRLQIKLGRPGLQITPGAVDCLARYRWPGNVRQLEHELERAAVVASDENIIDVVDLSAGIRSSIDSTDAKSNRGYLRDAVESLERELITQALRDTNGNIQRSSEQLGLTRKGLRDKIARYGINYVK